LSYWEEFNLVDDKGLNFGWPIYEGHHGAWPYGFWQIQNPFAPNPEYDGVNCDKKYFNFNELIAQDNEQRKHDFLNPCNTASPIPLTIPTYIQTRPILYYNNVQWNQPKRSFVPGFNADGIATEISTDSMAISDLMEGYSAIPGSWYEEGSLPDSFNHSMIISDFSGWIKAVAFDEEYNVSKVRDIRSDIKGVVHVKHNPIDDCLYYVHILSGEIRKICFGGNPPPVAVAKADKVFGGTNLEVNFDASESYDPNLLPFDIEWDFRDGTKSTEKKVKHAFTASSSAPEKITVLLTVTDSLGASAQDSIDISLNNTPPSVNITSPILGNTYAVNGYNRLDLAAAVVDSEEENEELKYKWQIHLHHNLHFHSEEPVAKKSFSTLLEPVGCGEKDIFWYRVTLDVEDSYGLKGMDEVLIYPNCEDNGEVIWQRFGGGNNKLILNWENISPENPERIVIQKIDDAGNILDLGESSASFTDTNPIAGLNRYRLKVYTSEDKYFFSNENSISFPLKNPLSVFPNPARSSFVNLKINQHLNENINISIYNISGIKLIDKNIIDPKGRDLTTTLIVQDLAAGVYIVRVKNGDLVFQERLEILK